MKHLVVLTFALVAASWINISQGVSSRYGSKGPNDDLLHKEYVVKKYSWWRGLTADVQYPPQGYVNTKPITAIFVIDCTGSTNKTTGHGSLSKGGPGETHATVHLKSPFGVGLNFTVEFYGAPGYLNHHG